MTLSQDERERFRRLIERRVAGEPLPYLTGYQEFWSIRFKVDSSVLIPRPETEVLVEEALHLIERQGWRTPRIVEVGTGCGAIAVSIAKTVPLAKILATEISQCAIALARENAQVENVASRICFVRGNLLKFLKSRPGLFDLVISNPPYIKRGDIGGLQPEIRNYEPRDAIDGGLDGFDFHRKLLHEGYHCLRKGGWLILEIGADQSEGILRLVQGTAGFGETRVSLDNSGRSRALVAQKVSEREGPIAAA
jgi:release factor glutamine methyltransferase